MSDFQTIFVQRLRSKPWTYKSKVFFILYPLRTLNPAMQRVDSILVGCKGWGVIFMPLVFYMFQSILNILPS